MSDTTASPGFNDLARDLVADLRPVRRLRSPWLRAFAWFALVYVANFYMSLYNRLRLEIKHENVAIAVEQEALPPTSPQNTAK